MPPTNDFGLKVAIHRNKSDPTDIRYSIWGDLIPETILYESIHSIHDINDGTNDDTTAANLPDYKLAILLLKNLFK